MAIVPIEILKKKNYLSRINNLVLSENFLFRNLYANVNGEEKDLLNDGQLSCAMVASGILYLSKLIEDLHATVEGTEKDMINSGWYVINEPKEGAIIIWGKSENGHLHMGFYVGDNEAISNDSNNTGLPIKHHYTYNDQRKIEKIYWHNDLN